MKKILFLVASLGIGGAQKIAAFVMNACVDYGYDVTVLSLSDEQTNVYLRSSISVEYLPYKTKNKVGKKIDELFLTKKIVDRKKPELIVIFGSYTYPSLGLLRLKQPIIGCERGDPNSYSLFRRVINRYLYKHFAFSVFQSNGARDYYKLPKEKTAVIPNPCMDPHIQWRRRKNTICCAGRLTKDKGFDTILDAFLLVKAELPEYNLEIYGEGPYKDQITEKINRLGLNESVKLCGKVSCLTDNISENALFVLGSWYEGLPNVLIEAMSIGIPIVATDCSPGGARFLTNDGSRGGLIVSIKNASEMAESIIYMLKNEQFAQVIGTKGKEIINEFSVDNTSSMWLSVISNFLE